LTTPGPPIILSTGRGFFELYLSYPEGNFGDNQLLDPSIGLSPLHTPMTNDLHVSIATSLHQTFAWLHPKHAQLGVFRVSNFGLFCIPENGSSGRETVMPLLTCISPSGFLAPTTRRKFELLGPCFKTGHRKSVPTQTARSIDNAGQAESPGTVNCPKKPYPT